MTSTPTLWSPDGWDATVRVGILTPHADVGPESEFRAMAPPLVGIHSARVPFAAIAPGGAMDPTIALNAVRAFAQPPNVDDAAELLAAAPLDAIAFGFTSSSYAIGLDGERAMIARLEQRTRAIPVVAACAAIVDALRHLEMSVVALFHPPWFDAELNELGRSYFESAGFDVTYASPCGLPSSQKAITAAALFDWVCGHAPPDADAIVIGGNGFRAVGIIAALESALDRPVLTANQALLWAALGAAGADPTVITGYGRLFDS